MRTKTFDPELLAIVAKMRRVTVFQIADKAEMSPLRIRDILRGDIKPDRIAVKRITWAIQRLTNRRCDGEWVYGEEWAR